MLEADYHVNSQSECTIRYVKSDTEYFRPHYHNYYEIFLTMHGSVKHLINGSMQRLSEGNLLFIRDFDIHDYASCDGKPFDFLNMSFSRKTLQGLFDYLGEGFDSNALLTAELPPCIALSPRERDRLFYSIVELNSYEDKSIMRTKMRGLLLNIFTKYFDGYSENKTEIPLWLELSYEKMKRPENFISGADRFTALSGKSREHLSRMMKKYYDITPTDYVTELRLNYAVNLMRTSNLSITDICYECGFSSLSWFYKLFEAFFGQPPAEYKKAMKN